MGLFQRIQGFLVVAGLPLCATCICMRRIYIAGETYFPHLALWITLTTFFVLERWHVLPLSLPPHNVGWRRKKTELQSRKCFLMEEVCKRIRWFGNQSISIPSPLPSFLPSFLVSLSIIALNFSIFSCPARLVCVCLCVGISVLFRVKGGGREGRRKKNRQRLSCRIRYLLRGKPCDNQAKHLCGLFSTLLTLDHYGKKSTVGENHKVRHWQKFVPSEKSKSIPNTFF